jgi:DNA-binding response OmpR family regulator
MGSGGGTLVRVGEVELDVNALVVSLPGKRRLRLAPNEMRLLHYLMTHAERVVERQELLRHLFANGHVAAPPASSNAVDVYIRRLRRKIERDPDQPGYIVTVWGRGYQFRQPAAAG